MPQNSNEFISLENISCPRCSSENSMILFKGKDYLHNIPGDFFASKCKECGLWFQNPRPSMEQIYKAYPSDYMPHTKIQTKDPLNNVTLANKRLLSKKFGYKLNNLDSSGNFNWKNLSIFNKWREYKLNVELTPRFAENGNLLEIGCASGGRLILLRNLGWENIFGIELVKDAADKAKEEGFNIICDQVENAIESFPDNYFDVVISSMVFEHLVNPFEVFHKISKKIKPGGQFLFSTVLRGSLDFKMYKEYWGGFDFPRHMIFFSKKDIIDVLKKCKFQNIDYYYQNQPIDFKRSSKWSLNDRNKDLINRTVFNLADSIFFKIFGMFLVASKLTTRVSFKCIKT